MTKSDSLLISLAIVISAVIISYSVINSVNNSTKIIKNAIDAKEVGVSEKAIQKLIEEARIRPQQPVRPEIERPKPGSKRVEGVTSAGNAIKGNPDAKVLMVEFSDFQCPFTKRFHQQVFPQIEKEYIESGRVKFAYRDFPLAFHEQAKIAAVACECAGQQGKYWQMFDKLIPPTPSKDDSLQGDFPRSNVPLEGPTQMDVDSFKKYAEEAGLDTKAFNKCLDNQETEDEVEKDMEDAGKFGVTGTPAFFINGRLVSGAMPFGVFKEIIEEELSK